MPKQRAQSGFSPVANAIPMPSVHAYKATTDDANPIQACVNIHRFRSMGTGRSLGNQFPGGNKLGVTAATRQTLPSREQLTRCATSELAKDSEALAECRRFGRNGLIYSSGTPRFDWQAPCDRSVIAKSAGSAGGNGHPSRARLLGRGGHLSVARVSLGEPTLRS